MKVSQRFIGIDPLEMFGSPPSFFTSYAVVFQIRAMKLRRLLSHWMFSFGLGSFLSLCEGTLKKLKLNLEETLMSRTFRYKVFKNTCQQDNINGRNESYFVLRLFDR